MKVWSIKKGNYPYPVNSLLEGLKIDFEQHRLIAAVGAGGKTTILYQLAEELAQKGKKVIVTTTTHMKRPEKHFVPSFERTEIQKALKTSNFITVGIPCEDGKIMGDQKSVGKILLKDCHIVLVEADGAHQKMCKAPKETEPVLPIEVDFVIGSVGASVIGAAIEEACHRPEYVANILGCKTTEKVTEQMVVFLLNSTKGQRKNVTGEYRFFINQTDGIYLESGLRMLQLANMLGMEGVAASLKK